MIKSIGELRTPIRIKKIIHRIDEDGFNTREYNDVFKHRIWCRWTWERGTETFENEKQRLLERAVMLLRFTDKIDERCVVEREDAPGMRWEIISVNVENWKIQACFRRMSDRCLILSDIRKNRKS